MSFRCVSVAVAGLIIGLVAGVVAGRQFPAHHYEMIAGHPYVLDASTGKVCFLSIENSQVVSASGDPFADFTAQQKGKIISPYPACAK